MPFPVPGRIAELLRRSTVQVRCGAGNRQPGCGSGVVLNDGRILTNAHVLTGKEVTVETWEGGTQRATVVNADPRRDLALLTADKLNAPAATLVANEPAAGQPVIAVGNPLGFVGAVSTGFIYQVGSIRGLGERRWIQADVRLAPGNSGGPLADISGQVVGVNTMVAGGLALSIPAASLQAFLSGRSKTKTLGVVVRPVALPESNSTRLALMILELTPGGPAERASLLPGDLLVGAGSRRLNSVDDLAAAVADGGTIDVDFLRSGSGRVRRVAVVLTPSLVSAA